MHYAWWPRGKMKRQKEKMLFSYKLKHGLLCCALLFLLKEFLCRHSRFSGEDCYENVRFEWWRFSMRAWSGYFLLSQSTFSSYWSDRIHYHQNHRWYSNDNQLKRNNLDGFFNIKRKIFLLFKKEFGQPHGTKRKWRIEIIKEMNTEKIKRLRSLIILWGSVEFENASNSESSIKVTWTWMAAMASVQPKHNELNTVQMNRWIDRNLQRLLVQSELLFHAIIDHSILKRTQVLSCLIEARRFELTIFYFSISSCMALDESEIDTQLARSRAALEIEVLLLSITCQDGCNGEQSIGESERLKRPSSA